MLGKAMPWFNGRTRAPLRWAGGGRLLTVSDCSTGIRHLVTKMDGNSTGVPSRVELTIVYCNVGISTGLSGEQH